MAFAERLKQLRLDNKLDREQLAKALDLTYSAIAKYETNARKADHDTLNKIADYFNVTTDYLLGRVDDPDDIMSVAYSRGGHNFTDEEKKYLESVMDDEIEKFLRIREQFFKDKAEEENNKKS